MSADERQYLAMVLDYRREFRENLKTLLAHHGQTRLTLKAHYLAGPKRGKRVSSRAIGYLLSSDPASPSPSLDAIAAVAAAFELMPWQILVPGLDPASPPHNRLTAEERKLYAEFQRLRATLVGDVASKPLKTK